MSAKLVQPGNSTTFASVRLSHRVGSLSLQVDFTLTKPWTILFGPSGSGKTTVLRTMAGFLQPHLGQFTYGPMSRILFSTTEKVFIPPHLRPIRTANQAASLFPHQTVRQNVAYGTTWKSHPQDELQVLHEVLQLMRLTTLADRRPLDLSGGEQQRVSVARAVASAATCDGPDKPLLLLDEPFAGLDEFLRDELALALQSWLLHWKIPVLSVSHDIGECHLLNAEVIRMIEGQIIEQGPAPKVLAQERERLLARLS